MGRLFEIVVGFEKGSSFLFAIEGPTANDVRTRWVADFSRTLRIFTQSLFPAFRLAVLPIRGVQWTRTRLLAGYMLMVDPRGRGLHRVYAELHAHWNRQAAF